jgi:hypothetical protein
MGIEDAYCGALEEGHYSVGGVDILVRVDDKILEGRGSFAMF